jgi:DNA primase
VEVRNLQKEITELEDSQNIKVLDITTMDGVLSRPVVESAIDSLKETLGQIDLNEISKTVDEELKGFSEGV